MLGQVWDAFHQGGVVKISIVDTGGANLASIHYALRRLGKEATVTSSVSEIETSTHVILPGVGAAGDSMRRLRERELIPTLRELKVPTLGICLGMQLLFEASEEGDASCLGILPGSVTRLPSRAGLPVPHMGWNRVEVRSASALTEGIADGAHFYFVHSYRAPEGEHVLADCGYGDPVPAIVTRNNFFGVQFHPERSSSAGSRLLENFLRMEAES